MSKQETAKADEYTKPVVKDYGDLAEITAQGRTGARVDATFQIGEIATFLSTSP